MTHRPGDETPMDDLAKDPHLLQALHHAPDAELAAPSTLSAAILQRARAAAQRPGVGAAPAAPAGQPGGARRRLVEHLQAAWAGLGRPRVVAAMASLMLATTLGLLWRGGLMDEPLAPAMAPESGAMPPAGEPPTLNSEAARKPAPDMPSRTTPRTAPAAAPPRAPEPAPAPPPPRPLPPETLTDAAGPSVAAQPEVPALPRREATRAGVEPPAERSIQAANRGPIPEAPAAKAGPEPAAPPAASTLAGAMPPNAPAQADAMPRAAPARARSAPPTDPALPLLDELLAQLAADPGRWSMRPGPQAPQAADAALLSWLRLLRREAATTALGASTPGAESAEARSEAPNWSLDLLDDGRPVHRFSPVDGAVAWERSAGSRTIVVPLSPQAVRQLGRTPPVGPPNR